MKSSLRYLLGVLSSLLLAAGLRAAADRLDPLSDAASHSSSDVTLAGAASCGAPCNIDESR